MSRSTAVLTTFSPLFLLAIGAGCPDTPSGGEGEGDVVGEGEGGEGEGGEGEGEGGEGEGGEGEGEVVGTHTAVIDGVLHLSSELPIRVSDCGFNDACDDVDEDGLVDAWENAALDRLRPILRFDEAEPFFFDGSAPVLGVVGRVAPISLEPLDVRVWLMLGYSVDYGTCGGFTGHNGDSERVVLRLSADGDGVVVSGAFTTGHEGTTNDQSRTFTGSALADLVYGFDPATFEPRWVVFPSAAKHATYPDVASCEAVSDVICVDEDCGADNVGDPSLFDRLPAFVNAGEPTLPLVTSLSALGFAGDDAWLPQDFCGGRDRTVECSAPVRDKLIDDPL